jgi:hypothetical protein
VWRAVAAQRTAFYRCHVHGGECGGLSNCTRQLGEVLLPRRPICVSAVTDPEWCSSEGLGLVIAIRFARAYLKAGISAEERVREDFEREQSQGSEQPRGE